MFSLSLADLERKIKDGNKDAAKIYEIRKDGNLLLCTLLLGNTVVNSTIAVLMSNLATGAWAAGISSVSIFIFAEVIPQALFSRHAFAVGAKTTWLVKIFKFLMYPVAKPMSVALNLLFGKELAQRYSKKELEILLEDHVESSIDSDEKRIMVGAMKFSEKTAEDVITPATMVFALEADIILNSEVISKIRTENYSRIPVYKGDINNIIGILFAKDLIGYEASQNKTVFDICRKDKEKLLFVAAEIPLDSLMSKLIDGRIHLSFVYNDFHLLIGIVSLEDIVEEIIAHPIMDESDTHADLQDLAKSTSKKILIRE